MELRALRDADLEQAWELDRDAFNTPEEQRDAFLDDAVAEEFVGAFESGRLLSLCRALPFGQYFGGGRVPMGGLSSVATAPAERGRGLAKRVIAACLEQMRERGDAVSSLFPATTELYRRLGWELSGFAPIRSIEPGALGALPEPQGVRVRRADVDEVDTLRDCYRQLAPHCHGFLDRPDSRWRHLARQWKGHHLFVAEDPGGRALGYLVYRTLPTRYSSLGADFEIVVEDHVATTHEAMLALWRLLGSWSSQCERLIYRGAPHDPLLLLLPEQGLGELARLHWMTRVVDAARAVETRGFHPGLECQVEIALGDERIAANAGRFVLAVHKGRGRLESGGRGRLELDVGAFACLYTGWATSDTLARSGRLVGGSAEERSLLDAAFAAPTAWMLDQF